MSQTTIADFPKEHAPQVGIADKQSIVFDPEMSNVNLKLTVAAVDPTHTSTEVPCVNHNYVGALADPIKY